MNLSGFAALEGLHLCSQHKLMWLKEMILVLCCPAIGPCCLVCVQLQRGLYLGSVLVGKMDFGQICFQLDLSAQQG